MVKTRKANRNHKYNHSRRNHNRRNHNRRNHSRQNHSRRNHSRRNHSRRNHSRRNHSRRNHSRRNHIKYGGNSNIDKANNELMELYNNEYIRLLEKEFSKRHLTRPSAVYGDRKMQGSTVDESKRLAIEKQAMKNAKIMLSLRNPITDEDLKLQEAFNELLDEEEARDEDSKKKHKISHNILEKLKKNYGESQNTIIQARENWNRKDVV